MPPAPTAAEEEAYYAAFSERVEALAELGGKRIAELERRIRDSTRRREKNQVNPTILFHFEPGQIVTRRHRAFSKMDPKTTGPFRVRSVSGVYRPRITIKPTETSSRQRRTTVHASQLVPFEDPYAEPDDIDVGPDTAAAPQFPAEDQAMDAEETADLPGPSSSTPKTTTEPTGPVTRSKRRRTAANTVWTLAKFL